MKILEKVTHVTWPPYVAVDVTLDDRLSLQVAVVAPLVRVIFRISPLENVTGRGPVAPVHAFARVALVSFAVSAVVKIRVPVATEKLTSIPMSVLVPLVTVPTICKSRKNRAVPTFA